MSEEQRADTSPAYYIALTKRGQKMLDDHGCRGWKFSIDPDMNDVMCRDQCLEQKLTGQHGLATGRTDWRMRHVSIDFGMLERRVPEREIVDVILHEIAHVLAGNRAEHGKRWIEVARRIGVSEQNWLRYMTNAIVLQRMRREARSKARRETRGQI